MALIDAFPGASGMVDSTELRKNLAGLIVRDTAGIPRGGVFPRSAAALVTGRADMRVDIAAFEGVSVRGGGPLFISNDGVAQSPVLPIPLANSQISVLYFKQNESASPYADADNLPVFGIVSGVASGTPAKPSIAGIAGAVELATITVPSTATATNSSGVVVTQSYQFTTTSGGVILFRTTAERDLYTAATPGQRAYVLATMTESVSSGAAWIQRGSTMLAAARIPGILPGVLMTTAYTARLSVTVATVGQQIVIEWSGNAANGNSGATRQATHAIFCDGVQVDDASKIHVPNGNPFRATDSGAAIHTPAAGSHVYELRCAADINSAVLGYNASIKVFG